MEGRKIDDPFLLLKEIKLNPSEHDQIIFVEEELKELRSLASLS
jgi:hypothetical protein